MTEIIKASLKEAIREEKPSLVWREMHGVRTPCAQIDLRRYELDFDRLLLSPVSSSDADLLSEPLKATWKTQFDAANTYKWFDGERFIKFYKNFPNIFNGLPSAASDGIPFIGFMFGGSLQKGDQLTPVTSRVLTLDMIGPESVHGHGLAVTPDFRRLGLASKLVEYSTLMLNQFDIGSRVVWDTNVIGAQVSGGWPPVSLWEKYGTSFGRMKNYGSGDSSVGDGIFFFANIRDLSYRITQEKTWNGWAESLRTGSIE